MFFFHLGYPTGCMYFHHIQSCLQTFQVTLLSNFCLLSPSTGSHYIILFVQNSIFNFFFFKLHACGEGDLLNRVFLPQLWHECHLPSSCFILHFSWCFSQLLIVGKNPRTDGVSSFMRMVRLLTCSTFLHIEDLGLHIYSCTSVLAYCRG